MTFFLMTGTTEAQRETIQEYALLAVESAQALAMEVMKGLDITLQHVETVQQSYVGETQETEKSLT